MKGPIAPPPSRAARSAEPGTATERCRPPASAGSTHPAHRRAPGGPGPGLRTNPDRPPELPHLAAVAGELVERTAAGVRFHARVKATAAVCSRCGWVSSRVHGRYVRRLADAAIGGVRAVIELMVRRFHCENRPAPLSRSSSRWTG
ncbi:transposase family protein [Kitasatospora sp. NPDC088346]|uniref:transposase family protein n=1 Tax=Kitasatospora sp. NPDC088346 TaxID=3364073 RepID=UPI00380DB9F3